MSVGAESDRSVVCAWNDAFGESERLDSDEAQWSVWPIGCGELFAVGGMKRS